MSRLADSIDRLLVLVVNESNQKISNTTRKVIVNRTAWIFRLSTIASFMFFGAVIVERALTGNDFLILFALAMPIHVIIILVSSWFKYRNPATGVITDSAVTQPLVSVIIPIYDQRDVIESVVQAIYNSDYPNIEVVAVNDGSTDGTDRVLEMMKTKYPQLKVIHKKNAGKRRAIASGFSVSSGKLIVLIDSDSVIHYKAVSEFVKTFNGNPNVGAVVGHVKVWNSNDNLLTKIQDTWYDFAFNIQKSCESVYGSVTCCSGCLAGYRKQVIASFIPYWSNSEQQYADDRELTSFAIATKRGKKTLIEQMKRRALKHASSYDDSDDRVLTATAMEKRWRSTYVSTAIVYTDVPDNFRQFYKQQLRWKKGFIRTNVFVSTFFWRRHPIMAFLFYFEMLGTFLNPILNIAVMIYEVAIVHEYWFPAFFILLLMWKAVVLGADYKLRDTASKTWKYKPVMVLLSTFFLTMMVFPAIWNLRKNKWGTR